MLEDTAENATEAQESAEAEGSEQDLVNSMQAFEIAHFAEVGAHFDPALLRGC